MGQNHDWMFINYQGLYLKRWEYFLEIDEKFFRLSNLLLAIYVVVIIISIAL